MLYTAILLAIVAAVVQVLVGIPEPWQKIVFVGVVILFAIGLVQLLGLF